MDTPTLAIVVVVGVAVAFVAFVIVRAVLKHRYVESLEERGWTFVDSPSLSAVNRLSVPPFGVDFDRRVDDQIVGEANGRPFQVLEYRNASGETRVALTPLPFPLPELVATNGPSRPRVLATPLGDASGPSLWCDSLAFAEAFMGQAGGAIQAYAGRFPLDLSVDGDQLVALGVPKKAEELAPCLDALTAVAASLDPAALRPFEQPPTAPGFVFYRHPDWEYVGDDDGYLQSVTHTSGGHNHSARHVIVGHDPALPFVALEHHWETEHTESSTDSQGHTTTRTVTDYHQEPILELTLPATMPDLEVGNMPGWSSGERVTFESEAFNRQWKIRTSSPKFASDVIHPRQMDYLMAVQPPPFRIGGNRVQVSVWDHSDSTVGMCVGAVRGFLSRVPDFVWEDLGLERNPFPG